MNLPILVKTLFWHGSIFVGSVTSRCKKTLFLYYTTLSLLETVILILFFFFRHWISSLKYVVKEDTLSYDLMALHQSVNDRS